MAKDERGAAGYFLKLVFGACFFRCLGAVAAWRGDSSCDKSVLASQCNDEGHGHPHWPAHGGAVDSKT